jgi:hypothetical protein
LAALAPADVASTMLILEELLNTWAVVLWASVGELTPTLNSKAPTTTISAQKEALVETLCPFLRYLLHFLLELPRIGE